MLSLYQRILEQGTIGNAAFIFSQKALEESANTRAAVIASRVALAKVSSKKSELSSHAFRIGQWNISPDVLLEIAAHALI